MKNKFYFLTIFILINLFGCGIAKKPTHAELENVKKHVDQLNPNEIEKVQVKFEITHNKIFYSRKAWKKILTETEVITKESQENPKSSKAQTLLTKLLSDICTKKPFGLNLMFNISLNKKCDNNTPKINRKKSNSISIILTYSHEENYNKSSWEKIVNTYSNQINELIFLTKKNSSFMTKKETDKFFSLILETATINENLSKEIKNISSINLQIDTSSKI